VPRKKQPCFENLEAARHNSLQLTTEQILIREVEGRCNETVVGYQDRFSLLEAYIV